MNQTELITRKICATQEILDEKVSGWKKNNRRIVFTNGVFDLIHRGHADYLAKARELGDVLIMGVNTDASVRRLKGEHRPIQDEYSRLFILASFQFVDAVILFDEQTPYELIKRIEPDVLVKGSDYTAENIVGYDIVTANNGSVQTIDFIPGFSTSLIEKRIKNS
jgi:rfaE bifunctional protein nucleotidyltransferase chain/domain